MTDDSFLQIQAPAILCSHDFNVALLYQPNLGELFTV